MDGRGHGPKELANNPAPSQELGGSKPLGKKLGCWAAGWDPRGGASQLHCHAKPHPFNRPEGLGS